jgi:hypothetical protein
MHGPSFHAMVITRTSGSGVKAAELCARPRDLGEKVVRHFVGDPIGQSSLLPMADRVVIEVVDPVWTALLAPENSIHVLIHAKRWDLLQLRRQPAACFPGVVPRLHREPQIRPVAAELAEPHGHVGGDGRPAAHHAVQSLPAYAQKRGYLADRAALAQELGQDVALEKHARMDGRPCDLVALNRELPMTHIRYLSDIAPDRPAGRLVHPIGT